MDAFLAGPDCVAEVREATKGGVETALKFAGAAPALELAWATTRRGGTAATGKLPHPEARMALPVLALVAEERRLLGAYVGSCVPKRDLPRLLALHRRGLLPVEKMLTHRLPLAEINLGMGRRGDPADRVAPRRLKGGARPPPTRRRQERAQRPLPASR